MPKSRNEHAVKNRYNALLKQERQRSQDGESDLRKNLLARIEKEKCEDTENSSFFSN
jgi:hypothetical protein